MNYLNIKVPKGKRLAVIGDIHEHQEQFDLLLEKVMSSDTLIVSLGDVADKGFGEQVFESITEKLKNLAEVGRGFVVKGNHELKRIKLARQENKLTTHLAWWAQQPLALSFAFHNGTRLTALHGGVTPHMTWDDLTWNIEVCYVRELDSNGNYIKLSYNEKGEIAPKLGASWHEVYDGRFGVIISGHHAQKDGKIKIYNYSRNIDTCVYETGKLTCQVIDADGFKETVTVDGKASHWTARRQ